MKKSYAIFMESEDGSICRVFPANYFMDEQEGEKFLAISLTAYGNDKTYLILPVLVPLND